VKRTELLQRIKEIGAVYSRSGSKHDVYFQPETKAEAAVPRHNEIKKFTTKAIPDQLAP
jgi:hypothetical protein